MQSVYTPLEGIVPGEEKLSTNIRSIKEDEAVSLFVNCKMVILFCPFLLQKVF